MTLLAENSNDKVMLFIDLQNVLKSVRSVANFGLSLDFYAMAMQLIGNRQFVGAYVFDTKRPYGETDGMARLHDKLRYLGFRIIARESYDELRQEQKEVDVALACEMIAHAFRDNYDIAILVSGDRDFIPAIQHVQASGKRVEVAAFADSVGRELRKSADRFHELETYPLLQMKSSLGDE